MPNILVVDDSPVDRRVVGGLIEKDPDLSVTFAANGTHALTMMGENMPALVLTDLIYPGWSATVDGEPATVNTFERMFRAIDVPAGKHTVIWRYHPSFVYWGGAIGFAALLVLAAVAHVRFWHPDRWKFLDEVEQA